MAASKPNKKRPSQSWRRAKLIAPLPIKESLRQIYKEFDVRDAKPPARFEVKAPKEAPNVVVILIDDMGFGASDHFGGPIEMPVLDRLGKNGLSYNRFHTTALCSPTRVAILTGYNHHSNNAGSIMEDWNGLSSQHRRETSKYYPNGGSVTTEWFQHGSVWQIS